MDSAPESSSAGKEMAQATGAQSFVSCGMRMVQRFGIIAGVGVLFGGVIATVALFLPYNRVVVFDQTRSSVIRMTSVRLKDGGFVALFLEEENGWHLVGRTGYLPRGYYRHLVIWIDLEAVMLHKGDHFIVRLYRDNGDWHFDETTDTPIKDAFGNIYTKHFWFYPSGHFLDSSWRRFLGMPLVFLGDLLFP